MTGSVYLISLLEILFFRYNQIVQIVAMEMMPALEEDSAVAIAVMLNKTYPVIRIDLRRLYNKVPIKGNPILIQDAKPAGFSKNPASVLGTDVICNPNFNDSSYIACVQTKVIMYHFILLALM